MELPSQIKSIFVTELKMLFVCFKNKCAINCLSKEKGWERLFDEREREREKMGVKRDTTFYIWPIS